jgi:sugar phosphate isomerase/epimerase
MQLSVILGNLGNTCDRFNSAGYKEQPPKPEQWRRAASIAGVTGIELVSTWDITESTVGEVKGHLADNRLSLASIIPDHFSQKRWSLGAFTSRDPAIRRAAISHTTAMMDAAHELGGDLINLWPGQDGFDYPFQGDFLQQRAWFVEGIMACAKHRGDVRLALEYKPMEPRTHSFLARAADTLLIALDTGCSNVGVTIDTGHSLMARENLAESAMLLAGRGKLFHLHCNDNYRGWDDDMIVGSLHLAEYLELFWWLQKSGYAGWFSMDQYPYREDGRDAVNESVRWVDGMWRKLERFGFARFAPAIAAGDPIAAARTMRSFMGIGDETVHAAR